MERVQVQAQVGSLSSIDTDGDPALQLLETERIVVGGHGTELICQSAGLLLPRMPEILMPNCVPLKVRTVPMTNTWMG
jgi:hypothetical protein